MVILVLVLAGKVRRVEADEAVDGVLAETLETTEETVVRSTVVYVSLLCRPTKNENALTLVLKLVKPRILVQFVLKVRIMKIATIV